ncbi:MAG: gfo/Idh/MocA family oxidoreductase, partial [Anaerolineae bacterium]|nr:gfo/Idh/MocA family oxidoreductase [Anaerolineae bacterium]
TVMMEMDSEATVTCSLSYASRLENNRFPEVFIRAECESGSVELCPDYWVKVTTQEGTLAQRYPPAHYTWAAPGFELVQSAIVPCNAHLLHAIESGEPAETSGEDNLKTMRLVFGAYESAHTGQSIRF